jgi:hypothetical protein
MFISLIQNQGYIFIRIAPDGLKEVLILVKTYNSIVGEAPINTF